jgi:hypothetical protein
MLRMKQSDVGKMEAFNVYKPTQLNYTGMRL